MAKGDEGKNSNTALSWETGSLNTKPISAEGLNSGMRGDIQAAYLRGPTQTSYVGMGQGTKDAMSGLLDNARGNMDMLESAKGFYGGLLDTGGINSDMRSAMDGLGEARGMYSDMYTRGAAGNPYLNDIIKQTNDSTYADVMASLGSRGAIGSSLHMDELGGALADNESRLRYQDYNDGFNRQLGALSGMTGADASLFGMGQTGQANAAAAAGGMSSLYGSMLQPDQIAVTQQMAIDADNQARAAFDPVLNHLMNYQGLLGGNAQNPQPAKAPGLLDFMGLIGGLGAKFL